MNEQKILVEAQHLQQYFPAGGFGKRKRFVQAVDDVSFAIRKGETLGLVGESGCGKTTVGRTLLRLYEPTDGRILYDGEVIFDSGRHPDANGECKKVAVDMLPFRRKMQMVFQDPYASLDPRMKVRDIVAEPLKTAGLYRDRKDREDKVASLLKAVGLFDSCMDRYALR